MALTRAQLLMGNDQQGAVLPGEVQAVKQGAGILIDTDGTISVDASSVAGLVKLNSTGAFNGYVWPNAKGAVGQVLTMGAGNNLTWSNGGVFVGGTAPLNPEIGDLWFDCSTGQLLVYEDCTTGSPQWTSGSAGFPVLPSNTSATPTFIGGAGTVSSPYVCSASTSSTGGAIVVNRVTVTDLAPFQFVQIVDLNAVANGGRFSVSNNAANGSGVLVFDLIFTDNPVSLPGVTYTCLLKVGTGTVYIQAPVSLTNAFIISNPGSITGNTDIGSTLTYSGLTLAGGVPPYTPTWQWRQFSDGSVLQNNGNTYQTTSSEFDDSIFITVNVQDSEGQIVSGVTPDFGPVSKPPFPNPTPPIIPSTTTSSSCFTWDGSGTTLSSGNCLLFSVNGGQFGQGPVPVVNGATICTKWDNASPNICANATSGTYIEGCLFDISYSSCGSLVIDRIPSSFTFTPVGNLIPNAIATSASITPTGFNSRAYITVGATSNGVAGTYQASIGGGSFQPVPSSGTYTLGIDPGQSLVVKFQVGATPNQTYNFNVQIGDSTGFTAANFAATTVDPVFPNLPTSLANGPTTIPGIVSGTWADGTVPNLISTGCLQISLDGSSFGQGPLAIGNGSTLYMQWDAGSGCGAGLNGTIINGTLTDGFYINEYQLQLDKQPVSFGFTSVLDAQLNSPVESNNITLSGFNAPCFLTLGAGSTGLSIMASVNGGSSYTAVPASGNTFVVNPNSQLRVKLTTGTSISTPYVANLFLGDGVTGTTGTFSVTTTSNPVFPVTPITFPTSINGTGSVGTSVPWGNGNTTLDANGCIEFSTDGGSTFNQGPQSISDGVVLKTRWLTTPSCGGDVQGTTINGDIYDALYIESASIQINRVPTTGSYAFSSVSNASISTLATSDVQIPAGYNATAYITLDSGATTLTGVQASVGGGSYANIPTSGTTMPILPGQTLQIRGTTGASTTTTYFAKILIGGDGTTTNNTWSVTTNNVTAGIATPTIQLPVSGTSGINPGSQSPPGITLQSSNYIPSGSAGTHASSTWKVYRYTGNLTDVILDITTGPTVLTFASSKSLSNFSVNDSIAEVNGTATGVIGAIDVANSQITLSSSTGTFNAGATIKDTTIVPAPPATEPPSADYTLIVNSINNPTQLTSYFIGSSLLRPQNQYYARVQYTSNATVVSSNFSGYNAFSTGLFVFSASGGTESTAVGNDGLTYKVHIFTNPGTFNIASTYNDSVIRVDIVGGGGGGARGAFSAGGGGGGSGALGYVSNVNVNTVGNYPVTSGAGGSAGLLPGPVNGGTGGTASINKPPGTVLVSTVGGDGGRDGGQGGGAGGNVASFTYPPGSFFIFANSQPGTNGRNQNGNRGGGSGGNAWNPNVAYNPSNVLFPNPIVNAGNGGGGGVGEGEGTQNSPGGPGSNGALRIYYPI